MARVQGSVSVQFKVDSSNKAQEIQLDGNNLLSTSVQYALHHTNFPDECKGQKVDAFYNFQLEDIPAKERGSSLVQQSLGSFLALGNYTTEIICIFRPGIRPSPMKRFSLKLRTTLRRLLLPS